MTNPPKILIVDDEPFNVDYLEQELEESDFEIISAANGREALEKVQTEVPDLILLDIMMPVMDGFEVLTRLGSNPITRDIPVIVISASNDLKSVVRGIQLGAEDYLPKPFEPILLHARVSSSLEKKRLHDLQQLYLKSLEREFEIAREIQQSFLPAQLPNVNGWEIAAYFKAAREVAGDFYDAFLLPNDQLVMNVGDVCGKGVGAAMFMTLFRSLIRAAATTNFLANLKDGQVLPPAQRLKQIISFTNNYIAETHEDASIFATIFIGLLDLQSGTLTYINCGNEPPLLLRKDGSMIELPPTGPVIGLFPDIEFSSMEIAIEKEDILLAFTDGISDTINGEKSSFGRERLIKILAGCEPSCSLLLQKIAEQANQFAGDTEQFDDITLLAVKRIL